MNRNIRYGTSLSLPYARHVRALPSAAHDGRMHCAGLGLGKMGVTIGLRRDASMTEAAAG